MKRGGRLVPVPATAAPGRLAGIEGLRATAAVAVVLHHVWILDGGARVGQDTGVQTVFLNLALGVTLFFALSGFLLYRPFAAAIARGRSLPSVRGYLRNRALRILPAYWAILAVTALVLRTAGTRPDGETIEFGTMSPAELAKSALLIQDYDPASMVVGIGPAWSLAVEAVFYLTLPLLALGVARLVRASDARARRVVLLLGPPALLLAVGLSGKLVAGVVLPASPAAGYSSDWHSVVERSFWAQADLFTFGMVAAVLHTEIVDRRVQLPPGWRPVALALSLAMFAACALTLHSGQLGYLPQNTVVGLAAALLIAVVAFPDEAGRAPVLQRALELPFVVSVGLVSYSVFLWNEPVVRWLTRHGLTTGGWPGLAANIAVTAVAVGALSVLTYRCVEAPALRRKRRARPVDAGQLEAAP
ncbi:MAG TPA: acyltransferase [Solirubrobacteraceae bacterium]|nr:acyltransferase [Solirubrobacteraceae bacterium]